MFEAFGLRLTNPAGLLALAALPLIAWLHLRRRRPRRVVVPSLTPWLVLAPADPPRRRRVPPTVLLLLHLTAAACLAFALAGPTWVRTPGAAVDRAIVLDVSTSMAAGERWAEALARVRALAGRARGAVTLVTLEARPRVLAARDVDGRRIRAALAGLAPGATGASTDAALALARAAAGPAADIVVVTDGGIPAPSPDLPAPSPDLPAVRWERVGGPLDNLAVVDAAARTTGGETRLFARLASFAERPAQAPVRLLADGREIDRRTVDLAPGGTFETVWSVPAGARTAEVRLDAADALAADNAASLPLERAERRIQQSGASDAVDRALGAIPDAVVERVGLGTFHADGSVPVSVFVGRLPELLPPGGVLLFNPPPGRLIEPQADSAAARITAPGEHPLVAGLDLTGVSLAGLTDPRLPSWAEPVLGAGGMTAVFAGEQGGSRIVVFAFDPDQGGVAARLAFPLLVARAIAWAAPEGPPAAVRAGDAVPLAGVDAIIQGPGGLTARARGAFENVRTPGLYAVTPAGDSRARPVRFAVHAGDVSESDLRRQTAFPADGAPGSPARIETSGGQPLWPWLAGLGLAVVLVEGLWRSAPARRQEANG